MCRRKWWCLLVAALMAFAAWAHASASAPPLSPVSSTTSAASAAKRVGLLTIDGAIGPATADYIARGIAYSASEHFQLVILQMDTPGGLDTSMRTVIKAILTSPIPVAVYVAPSGARAASAGTYILYASHVAAMAPGTNIGAATPVEVGIGPQQPTPGREPSPLPAPAADKSRGAEPERKGPDTPMARKQVNDAAAYLRGLAQMRGRNADWAELAVREAVSLSAHDALEQHVIEFVAEDLDSLLAQLDEHSVTVHGHAQRLHTKNAAVVPIESDWRNRFLAAIANPSVALLLMTIGIYGLVFEFMNPGFVAPGVIGAISLLLGLYALQLLPVNYVGLALIMLGLMFMIAEAFLPSFGVLGLGGIVAFVAGALMLIDTALPGFGIPPVLIVTLGVLSALLLAGIARIALATRRRPVTSATAGLPGSLTRIESMEQPGACEGWVRLEGELWKAVSPLPLKPGQMVRVLRRDGLTVRVAPAENNQGG
ncbi:MULTISPECIES: nodulation protein NfeD [unclassified Massilia]|uniref:NfeD family protein n=1 Tax=unclassified Massilia TaxID=2609279 RepID=UPI001B814BF9|nr:MULTISPECIES: nodulation protein NfeD [unclassified Massilia]MBQ5941096.1 nodulation protein NfeD [Massilia sp. AB1]MBQ5964471.1 nodulation protein NfeD [Massilia sp. ZL223]